MPHLTPRALPERALQIPALASDLPRFTRRGPAVLVALLAASLLACRTPDPKTPDPSPDAIVLQGIDEQRCVGALPASLPQLEPTQDAPLLAQALAPSLKGGLCAGQVFVAVAPVRVYRVWDGAKAHTKLGRWWALAPPAEPVDAYRQRYAICPEWSALDRLVSCALKPGARVVVGPTQSASCEQSLTLPKTPDLQVFIPNDTRVEQVFVEDCQDEEGWPQP